jgi:hypothetical protein
MLMWLLSAFPAAIGRCTTLEPRCTTAAEEEAEAEADEKEAAERREEEAADAAEAASTWSARGRSVAGSGFWSARGVRLYMVEADKAAMDHTRTGEIWYWPGHTGFEDCQGDLC